MIINDSKILVDYTLEYDLDYERIIGDIENPTYRDIKFDVYIDDEYLSVYFWADYLEKTITITSGAYHDEPLPKEVVDVIVDRLNLKGYTLQ